MRQVRHGSATTTHAVRGAIQRSQVSLSALSKEFGISSKTVAKWWKRVTVEYLKTGPNEPRSMVLTEAEEAVIVAFRRHTLLSLEECLYALQPSIAHLRRSALHRCLQRYGISRLPNVEVDKQFAEQPRTRSTIYSRPMRFDMLCEANGIERRPTKPNHALTNGHVERVNRAIKDATIKHFHYDNHEQLRTHLADFSAAYNFARRLKTLTGLTPYECICKIWISEPNGSSSTRSTRCRERSLGTNQFYFAFTNPLKI